MKQTVSIRRLLVFYLLPALLLLFGSLSRCFSASRLYPTHCAAGLLALCGCLLWGSELCRRLLMARSAAAAMTALLAAQILLYFAAGLPGTDGGLLLRLSMVPLLLALPCMIQILQSAGEREVRIHRLTVPAAILSALAAAAIFILLPGGELPAVQPGCIAALLFFGLTSCLLRAGRLDDGTVRPALLRRSDLPLQLMDREGTVVYGADEALPISVTQKNTILASRSRASMTLDREVQLSVNIIRGGYALIQKDLHDLTVLREALTEESERLAEANALLARHDEVFGRLEALAVRRDFFARRQRPLQEKTDCVATLLHCAAAPDPEPGFRRMVVTRANVLVTYLEQLGVLLDRAEETETLSVADLGEALEASAQTAASANIRCRVYNVAQGFFPAGTILALYDIFEQAMETVLTESLGDLEVRLRNERSGLRLVLTIPNTERSLFDGRRSWYDEAGAADGLTVSLREVNGAATLSAEYAGGEANE